MTTTYLLVLILCIAVLCVIGIIVSVFFGVVIFRLNNIISAQKDILNGLKTKVSVQNKTLSYVETAVEVHSAEIANLWDEWVKLKMLFGVHDAETTQKELYQSRLDALSKLKMNFNSSQ